MFAKRNLPASAIIALMAILTISVGAQKRDDDQINARSRAASSPGFRMFHKSFQIASASKPGFTTISVCPSCVTFVYGINEWGLISGAYFDGGFTGHGFFKNGDTYVTVDPPDSLFTECGRSSDAGNIVGDYFDANSGTAHPFVRNPDGSFSIRPGFPGAFITFALGINQRGDIVGSHTDDPNGVTGWQGYVMRGNDFIRVVNYPGATTTSTYVLDINDDGTIVGAFKTTDPDVEHGFVLTPGGQYTQLDIPGSIQSEAYGINNSGDIVGRYRDAGGVDHGYLLRNGAVTTIDYTGPETYAWGVNSKGTVVGFSTDAPFGLSSGGFELPKARKK